MRESFFSQSYFNACRACHISDSYGNRKILGIFILPQLALKCQFNENLPATQFFYGHPDLLQTAKRSPMFPFFFSHRATPHLFSFSNNHTYIYIYIFFLHRMSMSEVLVSVTYLHNPQSGSFSQFPNKKILYDIMV